MAVAILGTHAHADVPRAPILWALEEGQTRIRLQWNSRGDEVIDHKIEVCAELDAGDCDETDWTVLVADHPQEPSSTRGNMYKHEDLPAGSTRHYRVSSRNDDGMSVPSTVRNATTNSRVLVPECAAAFWSAEVTVARGLVFDKRGYMSPSFGSISDSGFSRRAATHTVTQLYFNQTSRFAEDNYGWTPDYHFAITTALPETRLGDFVLYVGEVTLPFGSVSAHSTQTYGESYRWGSAAYKDTFDYVAGDKVTVCLTDAAPSVTLVLTPDSISESGASNSSTVTATVEQAVDTGFTVTVSAEAVSPAHDRDFTISANKVLTFAANAIQSTGTVTITANDNNVYEPGKTVKVSGELPEGARPTPPFPVILDIEEDDRSPELSLSVDPEEISEDGGGSTVMISTGTAFPDAQTITLAVDSNSTATETDDYTVSSKSLTLPAKQTEVTTTITAEDDSVYEGDETVTVTATHGTGEVGEETITIKDSETAPALSIANAEADEGKAVTFEVELTGAVGTVVEVSYETSNGNGAGDASASDYTAARGTLTFRLGEALTQTITVTTTEDTLDEPDEDFTVTLTGVTVPDGVTVQATPATGTIKDDDTLSFEVSVDPDEIGEADTGSSTVTVSTGDVTFATNQEITLGFAPESTATADDYTVSATTLTLVAGATEVTATVTAVDDTLDEDEETIRVTAEHDGAAVGTQQEIRLTDDDTLSFTVEVDPDVIGEADTGSSTVTVSTRDVTFATDQEITLEFAPESTATADDYTVSATTLTLVAGATEVTATVTAVDDTLDEDEETIRVTAEHDGAAVGTQQQIRLTDDDTLAFTVSVDPDVIGEADTGSSTVTVSTGDVTFATNQEITLGFAPESTAVADDYTVSATMLTLVAGATEVTATVTAVDDTLDEDEETIRVTAEHDGAAVGTQQEIRLTDDDTLAFTVSVDPDVIGEADTGSSTVTVSTRDVTFATDQEIELSFDGTAVASDYTVSATTLTLVAGATEVTATVTAVDDTLDEDEETIRVTAEHDGTAVGTQQQIRLTDDDTLAFTVEVDPDVIGEADTGSSTVTVSTRDVTFATDQEIELSFDGTAVASDYTVSATMLTLVAGATEVTATVTAVDDTLVEGSESIEVAANHGGSLVGDPATITITDDDSATVSVKALTVEDDPDTLDVDESDDKSIVEEGESAMFLVELSGRVASVVQVSYSTGADDDTAAAGTGKDYTAATGKLTFAANETSKTVEVATLEDDLNEGNETFTLKISAPDPAVAGVSLGTSSATGTITDTDALSVSVTADQTSVNEGETATFTVTLPEDSTSTAEVVVNYEVGGSATGGEDYTEPSQTLAIAAGAASGTISIVTLEDQILESDQTVTVTLESAASSGRPVTVDMTEAVVTIVNTTTGGFVLKDPASEANGNTANVQVSPTTRRSVAAEEAGQAVEVIRKNTVVACTFPCILEGTSATRAVKLEDEHDNAVRLGLGETVVASYRTSDRTATAGDDYTALTGTLTLTYDNTKTDDVLPEITFETKEDSLEEDDETFRFTIDPANLPGGGQTQIFIAELTIRDDDSPGQGTRPRVTFSSPDYTRTTSPFTLAMTFLPSSVLGVTGFDLEDIQTTNGTAADFSGSGRSYSVQITPDDGFRGDLIVAVPANVAYSVAHPDKGNVGARVRLPVDTTATVPDVVEVDVSFGAATYTALEDGAPATVTVLLSADPERRLVVPLTARNGNGASDDDYSGVPEQVTFASGQTSTTFTVTATSDIDEDAGETVTLGFGELPAAVSTASPDRATITLAGESSKTRYARVMRTLLPRAAAAMSDATVGAISNRIDNVGSQGNLSLAGVNVLPSASVAAQERSADAISWASRDQTTRNISSAQLMDGSSFVMTLADRARLAGAADPSGSNPGTAALWGSGDYRNLAGSQNALAWRGNLVSLHLGADLVALPELVAGVAVARSLVGFDYTDRTNPRTVTGKFETDLLSVHPYASWTPTFGLGFWATGGVGWGGVGIDDSLDERRTSTTRLLTGALGGSSRLLSVDGLIPGGATALRLKGEGFVTQTLAEENGPIVAQDVGVQRVRLALEGSHEQRGLWGSILTPALEVGLRHDGGDAAQGAGLELGGELRYVQPELGLTVEGRGRVLTTHRAATQEWGVGGKIQLELGADRQGLSLSLAPSLGVAASGTHTLWQQGVVPGSPLGLPSSGVTDVTSRLDAQADYGLLAMGGQGMLTPYGGFSLAGRAGRDYRAGARLETDTFNLSLEGMRSERDSGVVDHGLTVQGAIRF